MLVAFLTWPDAVAVSAVAAALALALSVIASQIYATGREDIRTRLDRGNGQSVD
jgi:hypothetical protein